MSDVYTQYANGLMKLIRDERPEPIKQVIHARLTGIKDPVHNLVSSPLSKDEADENAVFYYINSVLEKESNEAALMSLRRSVIELLMEALSRKESLFYIDALGQLAGTFRVKEHPSLAELFRQQLWGYMNSRLGKPPRYKQFIEMMQLEKEDMEYACRALDLWLVVTPPLPQDKDAAYYGNIFKLFEESVEHFSPSELHFYLITLVFRAAIKVNPYYTGRCLFLPMCKLVEKYEKMDPSNSYRSGWFGLCNELGLLFDYDESIGREWKDQFIKGLREIDERLDREKFFRQSLKYMNVLDKEIEILFKPPESELHDLNYYFHRFERAQQ